MSNIKKWEAMSDEQIGRYAIKGLNRIIQQGCDAKPEDTDKDAVKFVLDHIASQQRELAAQRDRFKREVEQAYREGFQDRNANPNKAFENDAWGFSRARRVVEGIEV